MSEPMADRQLFLREAEPFIDTMRTALGPHLPTLFQLEDALQAVAVFRKNSVNRENNSFYSIVDCLEALFAGHLRAQTTLNKVEFEAVELATDWLVQLAILYAENLPEPKSLVAELIYAFALMEFFQDAVSLSEPISEHSGPRFVDPFLNDPEFAVTERPAPFHRDPFVDDPGFGLEFDLLQRTISFAVVTGSVVKDPFIEDPSVSASVEKEPHPKSLADHPAVAYDFFAGDPPLSDSLDM